ncbi:hypothetical protein DFH27DRAFT_128311 [Peziza echinospora]|nr:hypothetical protein DFH27DRAFT_128311 [Peziza echinospora]
MDPEPTMENEAEEDVEQTETPSLDEISGTVLDEEGMEAEESVKVTEYHDSSEWSNRGFYAGGLLSRGFQPEDWIPEPGFEHLSKPKVRDPRPEEIQKEPTVTFIGSENLHSPRQWGHRATVLSEGEYAFLNLPRGHYRAGHRTYARLFRPGPITKLPFEILTQVVEYVGMAQLDNDPREELLVYDRARAECTRALELRHLRRVNKQLYGVVQKIIYTRVSITSIFDLDRFLRTVQFRERLSSLVIDITVDIPQLKSHQIRFTPPGKMAKSTYSMIRGIYGIFECCKSLTRFAFHCTGAIQAFGKLEGFYPSLRKVVVCDLLDIGKSSEAFWKNLPLFPNLEEVSLVRSEENRDLDHRKWQISPVGKPWISHDYLTLQLLKFSYCPDVSDKILHKMLPSLPNLNKLMLHECKLVTSSGLARLINKMNGRLTELYYYDYVDCSGKVSEEEQKNKRPCHLCPAIAKSPKLQSLTLSAYRLCSVLWDEAYWEDLHTLKIDLMFYTGCENDEDDDKDFRLALLEATREGRLPSLTKEGFFFQTNSPGMIYRRKYKHTEEQIARATGYIV